MTKLYKLNGEFDKEFIKVLSIAIYMDVLEPAELEYMFENSSRMEMYLDLVKKIRDNK